MVSLLIYLLVLILIFGVILYVIRLIPIEEPFRTAAIVVIALIFVLVLLGLIGVIPGFPGRIALSWLPSLEPLAKQA